MSSCFNLVLLYFLYIHFVLEGCECVLVIYKGFSLCNVTFQGHYFVCCIYLLLQ